MPSYYITHKYIYICAIRRDFKQFSLSQNACKDKQRFSQLEIYYNLRVGNALYNRNIPCFLSLKYINEKFGISQLNIIVTSLIKIFQIN